MSYIVKNNHRLQTVPARIVLHQLLELQFGGNVCTYIAYICLRREQTKASLCIKGGALRANLAPQAWLLLGQGRVGG